MVKACTKVNIVWDETPASSCKKYFNNNVRDNIRPGVTDAEH